MDLKSEQARVRRQSALSFLLCATVFTASVVLLPRWIVFPLEIGARLAFAIQTSLVHFVTVLFAVRMVSSGRYRSAADISGSAKGPPSPALAVKSAFLQNTLEQAFVGVGAHLLLASIAGGRWLALLVASALLFAIGGSASIAAIPTAPARVRSAWRPPRCHRLLAMSPHWHC